MTEPLSCRKVGSFPSRVVGNTLRFILIFGIGVCAPAALLVTPTWADVTPTPTLSLGSNCKAQVASSWNVSTIDGANRAF